MCEETTGRDPARDNPGTGDVGFRLRRQLHALWQRSHRSTMLYGVLGTAVRMGANIFLLPLVVTRLTSPELALWWVFLALGGLANLADFGFGPAIARVFNYLWAGADDFVAEGLRPAAPAGDPNLPRIRELASTVRYFYFRLSAALTLLMALAGTAILLKPLAAATRPWRECNLVLLQIPVPMPPATSPLLAWTCWGAFVLATGYSLGTSYWTLACQGVNRMRDLQAAYLWGGLAYAGVTAALLLVNWGLAAMVAGTVVRALVVRLVCRRSYLDAVPALAVSPPRPVPSLLRRLWPNASKLGVLALGAYCIANGGVLISSHYLGDQTTATFGLTAQIGTFLMNFAALWLTVKWPQLAILRAQGRLNEMSTVFARRLALTLATFAVLAVALVALGNPLLAWKGSHTRLLPTGMLCFYLLYLGQQLFSVQFGSLVYTENVVPFFAIGLLTGLGMIALSLLLTPAFGMWGLLIAPLLAESAVSSWYTVRRGLRGQPLTVAELIRAAAGRGGRIQNMNQPSANQSPA